MFIEDEISFTPVYTRNQSSRCTCVIAAWPLIGGLGAAVLAVVVIVVALLLWRKHKKQRTIADDGSLHVDLLPPVAESLEDSISQHDSAAEYNAPLVTLHSVQDSLNLSMPGITRGGPRE